MEKKFENVTFINQEDHNMLGQKHCTLSQVSLKQTLIHNSSYRFLALLHKHSTACLDRPQR